MFCLAIYGIFFNNIYIQQHYQDENVANTILLYTIHHLMMNEKYRN